MRQWAIVILAGLAFSACGPADTATTTSLPLIVSTTSSTVPATTTTTIAEPLATASFQIPKGPGGVTFDEDGDPPGGPTSFAVMADGSVIVADTYAVDRGEPRLLRFDRTGTPMTHVDLARYGVWAVVDIATDGDAIAVLDVYVAMNRYRVLILSSEGELLAEHEIPEGFRFEDGLTGIIWDDSSVLLEFEFGASYGRLTTDGIEPDALPVLHGRDLELAAGEGGEYVARFGSETFAVSRPSELGGVTLVGVTPDNRLVLLIDEVDMTGPAIRVVQHVRRYSPTGEVEAAFVVDLGSQFVEIARPWELDADGNVLFLAATSSGIVVMTEGMLTAE